ncbi:MAG: radical SAM protein [Desulfovermiculus sp.]|nr:radical SAM protein [Desulfovermiculus sp.]
MIPVRTPPLEEDTSWSFVRGLQPGSLCDWPGRVSAVLFLGGCNLRCSTCHNARLAWTPDEYPPLSKTYVQHFLHSRSAWLDGLVVSGGEPTFVPELTSLLKELTSFGLPLKLDTNGLRPDILGSLLAQDLIQAVAVDIKGPWAKYPLLTGGRCSPAQAQQALGAVFRLAKTYPQAFSFRCTAVPDLSARDLEQVQKLVPFGFSLSIQTYVPPEKTDKST